MVWFGRLLQLVGLFEVGYGLIVGGFIEGAMGKEMKFALIGATIFILGRIVEGKAR